MFKINGILAITNGERPFLDFNDKKGTYANGIEYYLIKGMLVISTEKIITDESEEGILKTIEEGSLDIWPLTTFRGWNNIAHLKDSMVKRIDENNKRRVFRNKVLELESRYPTLTADLRESIYNLDWYYQYSDDISVYRNAAARHEKVKKQLEEIGMKNFYDEYRFIVIK